MSSEIKNKITTPNIFEDTLKRLEILLPTKETFFEDRKTYIKKHQDKCREIICRKNLHKNDETRLEYLSEMQLRCAYVFEIITTKFLNEQDRKRLKLIIEDDKKSKRTPLKTIFDTDIFNEPVPETDNRKQLFIAINHESFAWIVDNIFKNEETDKRDIFHRDWCESLESSMVQEIAHVIFIADAEKDKVKSQMFLAQLQHHPKFDDSLSNEDREKFYLSQDIEKHGRLWESVFLNKYYPNSWAEAWLKNDLEECNSLKT